MSSSSLIFENYLPLSAKKPYEGKLSDIHLKSVRTWIIVSAFLFEMIFPTMNLENKLIIHSMDLVPNSLRSRVTPSFKDVAQGSETLGLATEP